MFSESCLGEACTNDADCKSDQAECVSGLCRCPDNTVANNLGECIIGNIYYLNN